MTPLEYMEKQVEKHRRNLEREAARDVPTDMVYAILAKVHYYEAAVEALREQDATDINVGNKTNADHIRSMTDEELAKRNVQDSLEYTVDYDWDERPIGEYTPCFKTSDGAIFWSYEDAVDYELHWLKQPYKEDT